MKVWSPGQEIADAARRLQSWWVDEWTELVPILMSMKADQEEEANKMDCEEDDMVNERGEDFQEQVGMPDEENMRHWSHHYSTDTVDDPIFRAAMRGCDSVSFVFGLEVTWSLIQERQQLEEDRMAAEACQVLGDMPADIGKPDDDEDEAEEESEDENKGGSGSSDDEEDGSDKEQDKTLGGFIEQDVESDDEEKSFSGEDKAQESESEDEEKSLAGEDEAQESESEDQGKSSAGEDEAPLEIDSSQKSESSASDSSHKSSPGLSAATDTTESLAGTQPSQKNSSNTSQESPEAGTQESSSSDSSQSIIVQNNSVDGPWSCSACTFENKTKARKCAMCKAKRPPRPPAKKKRRVIDDSD
jgi:hypothetical protein